MQLTPNPIRELSAADINVPPPAGALPAEAEHGSNEPTEAPLTQDDQYLQVVQELLDIYGGVIFVGPPGTSKSWYAAKIAEALVDGDPTRVRFIQFHPSYQYEDFVEGFVPRDDGTGFDLKPKHLLKMCEAGERQRVVLVIDELSRGDPGRIFGEALTYVEKTKRGLRFQLASGREVSIPENVVFLATMNPLDRGVDEVDAAFERRFGRIRMDPDARFLEAFLDESGMNDGLRRRVVNFFTWVNSRARDNPFGKIGHTYFLNVETEDDLRRLWDHQLQFVFEKAYQLDPDGLRDVRQQWDRIFRAPSEDATPVAEAVPAEAVAAAPVPSADQ